MPTPSPTTATRDAGHPAPHLRLVPAPACAPPYDDERLGPGVAAVARACRPGTAVPSLPPDLRLLLSGGMPDGRPGREVHGCSDALPPLRPFAHALVQALLEAVVGVRPLQHLRPHTTARLFAHLERLVPARLPAAGARPGARAVRSLHVQQQPGGVGEVSVTIRRGDRIGALALRFEYRAAGWRCTDVAGL